MLIKENHEIWSYLVLTTQTWTIALGVDSLRKLKGFSIMMVGETHRVVEERVWHGFHCDYPEAVVSDCYSHLQIIWSCHPTEKMKWNFVPFKRTHLSFLGGAKVGREPSCIPEKCSGAHIDIWHGSMCFSQNVQLPSLPQRFPQVGKDTRNEVRSKILTFHTASRSHSVSFRNKVPIFPQSLCPWHGPWTIHYHCSDGFSQKNVLTFVGIEKMLKRSK